MKTPTLAPIVLLTWLAYACTPGNGKENNVIETGEIPVTIQKLALEELSDEIHTSGQFTTNDETFLSFKTGGIIDKILVNEGDVIQKGQLLAILNLTEIDAQVGQSELELEKAERSYRRIKNLYADSVATLEQFQNCKTSLDIASRQLEAARFNRSYSEIRARTHGHVLRKSASEGQVITAGAAVLQTNGNKKNDWVLKVGLNDQEWACIRLGDKASISITAQPGEFFPAEVVRKSGTVDPNTGAFGAELQLTGQLPKAIASGLFGKAVITPSTKRKAWSIPYDALLDGGSQSGFVFVTNDMKTAEKREVAITSVEKDRITISKGLQHAHSIIISGSAYLQDNSNIRIIKE